MSIDKTNKHSLFDLSILYTLAYQNGQKKKG